jgi:geranylgeranyl diphosphate synthase type II
LRSKQGAVGSLREVLPADRRLIDTELRRTLRFGRDVPSRLALAMRYAVLGPGKRVRPMLALGAFRAAGGRDLAAVLPFCAGIELIHTFSLIHDDLPSMDNDDFRRGRAVGPSGMTGGQMMDIAGKTEDRGPKTEVLKIQRKKTAEFIAAAVVTGAILGGAAAAAQEELRRAGLALGMLFQMTDDLLDSEQASEAGRTTMVSTGGRARARSRAESEARRAERLFNALGARYRLLAEFPELVLHRKS